MSVTVNFGGGSGAGSPKTLQITTMPTKTSYVVGDKLNLSGMVLKVIHSDGTTENVSSYTASPANGATLTAADTKVTLTTTTSDGSTLIQYLNITVASAQSLT